MSNSGVDSRGLLSALKDNDNSPTNWLFVDLLGSDFCLDLVCITSTMCFVDACD